MEAIKISLDDYVLSGGGANGESYDHNTDPTVMLKLYFPGKIQQPLDEMRLARMVYESGISTPEPGDYVVTEDGRYGIRFRRIVNKVSYSRATGDHPERVKQYTRFSRQTKRKRLETSSTAFPTLTQLSTETCSFQTPSSRPTNAISSI